MPETIFIVRHAEAESNVQKYFAGFTDAPLTPLGKQQAKVLRKRLAHEGIGRAFSSDLSRAKGTLSALSLGCPAEFTPLLREKNYGQLEGVRWGEEEEKYAAHHSDPFLRAPGGESIEDVQGRVAKYFDSRIFSAPEEKVLVVSHHGPIVALACGLLGMPLGKWRHLRLGNCGLTILTRENGIWRLKLWNSLSHFGLQNFGPLFKARTRQAGKA